MPAMSESKPPLAKALFNRRMLICVFTGFSSGLPLYILISLLPAWLRTGGVDLKAIGLFALIGLPFTWKFLWSPLVDRYALPLLGRRRGWMLATQLALLVSLPLFGTLAPRNELWSIAALALAVALFAATQDIVLDAYRRELLPDAELGLGNSIHVQAYRIASLIPGALSLVLADHLPWSSVFFITALFMLPGIANTLLIAEPAASRAAPRTLRAAVVEPFHEFITRSGVAQALLVLAFIFLYKLGDSMATALATPFYLDMGFSMTEIGLIAKNVGLWASVIGGLAGGIWMLRIGINRGLWLFGAVQVVSIAGFAWLAAVDAPDRVLLAVVIAFEALGVGLGTAAFTAFIARTTDPRYTATQFALFTSLAAVPRSVVNATTGWIVDAIGWFDFYLLCIALALPGMALLLKVAPWNAAEANPREQARRDARPQPESTDHNA
ncbi:MAG TPA: AmpG family muropeptide MFS transporter [Casimicrobiaceae bacterium]|nr:AmpG family muropeptide MFS transporter [Casimicrobiaceae bacterium]